MAFFTFLVVNFFLFIRPAEYVPGLKGADFYFYSIFLCFFFAIPDMLAMVSKRSVEHQPTLICVLGLLFLGFLPYLVKGDLEQGQRTAELFAKVVVYFVLAISVVSTPSRVRWFAFWIVLMVGIMCAIALLSFYDVIRLEELQGVTENVISQIGDLSELQRLQGTGLLRDPNEFCVLIAFAFCLCMYFLLYDPSMLMRSAAVVLVPLFLLTIYETKSRGGLIAWGAGMGTLSWYRFGPQRTLTFTALGIPLVLVLFAGRQTEGLTTASSSQSRFMLWSDWMQEFREQLPLGGGFQIPTHEQTDGREKGTFISKHLAHNSYLQAFADTGILGGILYLGAFGSALWSVHLLSRGYHTPRDHSMRRLQSHVMGAGIAYCVGMLTLSLCWVTPTYAALGMLVAYTQAARSTAFLQAPQVKFDVSWLWRFAVLGLCYLVALYVVIRFLK